MHEFDLTNPDERNQAAAEYVLGTLSAAEKERFESLLAYSEDVQQEVEQWREYLDVLNLGLEPVAPSKEVWQKIKTKTQPQNSGLFSMKWQSFAFMSLLLVMSIGLLFQFDQQPNNVYVHLVKDGQAQPGWIMRSSLEDKVLVMESLRPVELPKDAVYEVWLMLKDVEPVSLGFLPREGSRRIDIDPGWAEEMMDSEIVVTLEGPQGAPSGWDMGPVSDRGNWITL